MNYSVDKHCYITCYIVENKKKKRKWEVENNMTGLILPIHSVLKTFQGEGISIGKPAVLLRVGGCNLKCSFCDVSDSSWKLNKNKIKYLTAREIVELINNDETKNITLLLITGGEPTIYMKEPYLDIWREVINRWIFYNEDRFNNAMIDIETNGTFEIYENLPSILDIPHSHKRLIVNISPKLNERFFPKSFGISNFEDLLKFYQNRVGKRRRNSWNFNYIFKFVLNPYDEDNIKRIERMIDVLQIPKRRVYILPLTPDENDENFRDKFIDIQRATLNYCIEHGYNFVPRLHIYMYKLFDDKMDEYHKII